MHQKFKIITSDTIRITLEDISENLDQNDRLVLSAILRSGKSKGKEILDIIAQDPFVGLASNECSYSMLKLLNENYIQMVHIRGENFYIFTNRGRQAVVLIRRHYE